MNFSFFIAQRISWRAQQSFTRVILRIAIIAIILSVGAMIISDAIVIGFQDEIKDKITGFAAHVQVSHTRTNFALENEPLEYSDSFVKEVQAIPEVRNIQVFATKPAIIKADDVVEGVVLKGVSRDFDWEGFSDNLTEESQPIRYTPGVPSADAILSANLADKLDLNIGDTIQAYFVQNPPQAVEFLISGIYATGVEEVDNTFMMTDLGQIQQLNGWDTTRIGGYEIFLNSLQHLDSLGDEIHFMADANQEAMTIEERYPQIFDWLGLLDVNIRIIFTLMTAVAVINMITALLIMILERTQMIGLLKALGSSNYQLQRVFVLNAMILIGIGVLVGDLIALLLLLAQKHLHLIKLPVESYYVSEVPVEFNWIHILLINLGAFVVCTLAMFLPALLVSRVNPVKAIRFE